MFGFSFGSISLKNLHFDVLKCLLNMILLLGFYSGSANVGWPGRHSYNMTSLRVFHVSPIWSNYSDKLIEDQYGLT